MAAHIYAASPGGPRGTGGLSVTERGEPENGIWCCFVHGKAIDSDEGRIFSAVQLKAWKRLHEARKAAEVNGGALHHIGLVESISVDSAPVASLEGRIFELGMRNIITGPNGSGKSILTRLIASVAHPDHVAEMSRRRDVDMGVRWFDPHIHDVTTKGRSGSVTHVLDGSPVPYVARPYKTILLHEARLEKICSLIGLAQLFDLSVSAMKSTLSLLPHYSDFVKEVRFANTQVQWTLEVDGRRVESFDHQSMSRSLQYLLLLELAGIHARHHARVEPTFLLLDGFMDLSHSALQIAALERLQQTTEHAQVAVVTHSPTLLGAASPEWAVTALEGGLTSRADRPIDFEVEARAVPLQGI